VRIIKWLIERLMERHIEWLIERLIDRLFKSLN
jgi:hypothetical protein